MEILNLLTICTGAYPLWLAWLANRRTSLSHAVCWAIVCWAAWGVAIACSNPWPSLLAGATCYLALSLTGCAAVAVLGARRPGVAAWNFVVVALFAVELLPLAESLLLTGELRLNGYQVICVAATLAVGLLNYLPTRLAPAMIALGLGCALALWALIMSSSGPGDLRGFMQLSQIPVILAPWFAYSAMRSGPAPASEFDLRWLSFRNRYGLFWSERLREQFNRSAAHASWPVILRWQGLRLLRGLPRPTQETQAALLATLTALMKRFGPAGDGAATSEQPSQGAPTAQ